MSGQVPFRLAFKCNVDECQNPVDDKSKCCSDICEDKSQNNRSQDENTIAKSLFVETNRGWLVLIN